MWATETFDPTLDDFEDFLPGYLDNPDRSLDVPLPGPVDPFSYGAAIFFEFLEERYGAGTVRALLERWDNGAEGIADPELVRRARSDAAGRGRGDVRRRVRRVRDLQPVHRQAFADPARCYANGADYPAVKIETVAAPYVDDALRVFYASTQYYGADPAGRAAMTAALVVPEGGEADLEGLRMLFAVRSQAGYGPVVQVADPTAASEIADTSSAARFVVAVVNTLQQGESRRPGLCIGTPEEVESCRSSLLGTGGAAGAGGAGGSAPSDGGQDEQDEGGCSCRSAAAGASAAPASGREPRSTLALGLGLGLAALRSRRSRRAGR